MFLRNFCFNNDVKWGSDLIPTLFKLLFIPLFLVTFKDIPCDMLWPRLELSSGVCKVKIINANPDEWWLYHNPMVSCIPKNNSL